MLERYLNTIGLTELIIVGILYVACIAGLAHCISLRKGVQERDSDAPPR